MIIRSSAPCRISLFGGGTDIDPFASVYGGAVINFAVNIRQQLTVYTGDDMWGHMTDVFPHNANKQFIYDIFHKFNYGGGHLIKVDFKSDAFLGAGLGSSAAAATATIAAIGKIKNEIFTISKIAEEAWKAEEHMGWYGGKQDQWASAYGGFNVLEFNKNGVIVRPYLRQSVDSLTQSMVLFWTGEREGKDLQEAMRSLTEKQVNSLKTLRDMVVGAIPIVGQADYRKIGDLLNIAWRLKKQLNPKISTGKVDHIYQKAIEAGALGGKLLGAGSGGYMLFIIEPAMKGEFLQKMAKEGMENIDFSIDWQGVEARIL